MFYTLRQLFQHSAAFTQVFPAAQAPTTVMPSASISADERDYILSCYQDRSVDEADDLPRAAVASLADWAHGGRGAGRPASRVREQGPACDDPDCSERWQWRAAAMR